jgi:hypothetical protein
MSKKPSNFRLSEENLKLISEFSKSFGFNQTEFLEFVLTLVRNQPELFIQSFEKQFREVINLVNNHST